MENGNVLLKLENLVVGLSGSAKLLHPIRVGILGMARP